MPTPLSDNAAWVDIPAPLAPPPLFSTGQIVLASSALLIILLLVLYWWWRQPRQRARWQLYLLQHRADHLTTDLRQLGWQLRATLCLGLRVINLQQLRVATSQQSDWHAYCAALTQLCYQAQVPSAPQLLEMIQQARYWLRSAQVTHAR